jgi:hypothetical protein
LGRVLMFVLLKESLNPSKSAGLVTSFNQSMFLLCCELRNVCF